MELIEQINQELKETLSEKRYNHSIGVMEMCEKLAKIHGEDVEKAKLAGILHDIAKEMSVEEQLEYATKNNIEINQVEKINTSLLHGKIGADIAKKKYGVDEEIQNAIKYHTGTSPDMDLLAKIVYVADKTELNRKSNEYDLEYERYLAERDLDKAVLHILNTNLIAIIKKGKLINKESIDTRNKLLLNLSNYIPKQD